MKSCAINGCNGKYKGLGYCNKHYIRFKKYGDPLRRFLQKHCKVDGCNGIYKGKGYCAKHYQRMINHKDINHQRSPKYKNALDAYKANLIMNGPDECWGWSGKGDGKGYGVLSYKPMPWKIHRYSYTLYNGEIPDGMYVLHKCDQPICSNPNHLFAGTNLDNIKDMLHKKRNAKGEMLPQATITKEVAWKIKEMILAGERMIDISRKMNVGYSLVNAIKRKSTWKHVIGD